MLHDLFTDFLEKPKESYQRIVQILGPIGSGKSCTAYRFGIELEREAKARKIPLRVVHVSCKLGVDSRYALYQSVLQKPLLPPLFDQPLKLSLRQMFLHTNSTHI